MYVATPFFKAVRQRRGALLRLAEESLIDWIAQARLTTSEAATVFSMSGRMLRVRRSRAGDVPPTQIRKPTVLGVLYADRSIVPADLRAIFFALYASHPDCPADRFEALRQAHPTFNELASATEATLPDWLRDLPADPPPSAVRMRVPEAGNTTRKLPAV